MARQPARTQASLLKYGGRDMARLLMPLFATVWGAAALPQVWTTGVIQYFFKSGEPCSMQYGADKNVHCRSGLWSGRPSPQPGFKPEALTGCFSNHLPGIHAETSAVQSLLLGSVIYGDLGWQVI